MPRFLFATALFALTSLAACAPPQDGCGLLACVSSPYVRARGGPGLVGQPVFAAIGAMGGAPNATADVGNGVSVLT